jgi:transcriptional regulator with XRE-family HTH domain
MSTSLTNGASIHILDQRRRDLGLTAETLASLSGVSVATVKRILRGADGARWDNVVAVANALEMQVQLTPARSTSEVIESQAEAKADRAVRLTQATSALEAQGVSEEALRDMRGRAKLQLLRGSRRALWK